MDEKDNIEDDDNEADRDKGNNGDNPAETAFSSVRVTSGAMNITW